MAIVALPVIIGIFAAAWIGSHYGWGYHALILVVLAAYTAFMFCIALGKRPKKEVDLSAFRSSSPESRVLGQQVAAMHVDVVRLDERLRLDAYLVPVLLFGPMAVVLLVLGQSAYSEEHRNWLNLNWALLIPYLLVRYAMPRKQSAADVMNPHDDPFANPSRKHLVLLFLSVALLFASLALTASENQHSTSRIFGLLLLGGGLLAVAIRTLIAKRRLRHCISREDKNADHQPQDRGNHRSE